MDSTGVVRKLDTLGRIVIPSGLRKNFGWYKDTPVEIFTSGDKVILSKYEPYDIFTGSTENLITFHGKNVSLESIYEMVKTADLTITSANVLDKPEKSATIVSPFIIR